jgi:hypothetical protein
MSPMIVFNPRLDACDAVRVIERADHFVFAMNVERDSNGRDIAGAQL